MKKLLLFLSIIICSCQLYAQSITSKKYTIIISDVKVDDRRINYTDDMSLDLYYEGYYTILKEGKEIIKQKFSASKFTNKSYGGSMLNVNIKNSAGQGSTTTYNYDTKRIDYYTEKRIKPKKSGSNLDIILSSILVYAKITYD